MKDILQSIIDHHNSDASYLESYRACGLAQLKRLVDVNLKCDAAIDSCATREAYEEWRLANGLSALSHRFVFDKDAFHKETERKVSLLNSVITEKVTALISLAETEFPLLNWEGATVNEEEELGGNVIEVPNGAWLWIDADGEFIFSSIAPPLKDKPFEEYQGSLICPTCGHGEVHPITGKLLIRGHKFTDRGKSYSQCLVCAGMYTPNLKLTPKNYNEEAGWFTEEMELGNYRNPTPAKQPKQPEATGILIIPARIVEKVGEDELRTYGWPKGSQKLLVFIAGRWRNMGYFKGAKGYKRVLEDADRKIEANGYPKGKFVLQFKGDK